MKSLTPQLPATAAAYVGMPKGTQDSAKNRKAWGQAVEFESVFLNTMLGQMFSGIGNDSPLGGKHSEAWRGMLVDEYARSVTKAGGIGLAPQVYRELVGAQEAAPRRLPSLPR